MADASDEADDPEELEAGAGRPPPPTLKRVVGTALLVVAFLVAAPALYAAGRDLSGSALVGALGLVPPAVALVLLYLELFR